MTPPEIAYWLGLPRPLPRGTAIRPEIIEGMKDTPYPADFDDAAQIRAFQDFLSCAGPPPRRVLIRESVAAGRPEDVDTVSTNGPDIEYDPSGIIEEQP